MPPSTSPTFPKKQQKGKSLLFFLENAKDSIFSISKTFCTRSCTLSYMVVSSGTISDKMVKEYINDQEDEQIAAGDSRFPIDNP